MAVTSDAFAASDLAAVIPEVWTPLIMEEVFAGAVAANWFTDLSSYASSGGDIFHVPDVYTNSFTKQTQATQGAEITTAGPAQQDVTLTINTHEYVAYIIGDKDAVQLLSSFPFASTYIKKSAGVLRTSLEDALFGLWSGLSTSTIGDTATVLADTEIRQGINAAESRNFNVHDGDWSLFFHPYVYWVQLGAVTKYYDQSSRGPDSSAGFVATGGFGSNSTNMAMKGTLYGIPVQVSSRVVSGLQTYRNLLANKMAFGYGTQMLSVPGASSSEGNRVRAQSNYELRNLGQLTVVDMIYGVTELRDELAVLLNASSAFIGS